jgi:[ribosomal protein S5]-alanine N-acetyltransferase
MGLRDDAVLLRPSTGEDAPAVAAACADADIARFIPGMPEARGFATRALRLLSLWAVTEGGVERLELTTHPENRASQRVAEKAGFVKEGLLRSHMRFREGRRDSILYSLVPSDLD